MLFLDIIFSEPDTVNPQDDATLVSAIRENGRVFLETFFPDAYEIDTDAATRFETQRKLAKRLGSITDIEGEWKRIPIFFILKPQLAPYSEAIQGNGHAGFIDDYDKVFRHASLIVGAAELIEEIPLEKLTTGTSVNDAAFERVSWTDKTFGLHDVSLPIKNEEALLELREQVTRESAPRMVDKDGDGTVETETYFLSRYREFWVPSIALSLAAAYVNVPLTTTKVVLDKENGYILLPSPQQYNSEKSAWEPYSVVTRAAEVDESGAIVRAEERDVLTELKIPIDETCQMLVNFMGPSSSGSINPTFTVRSYGKYAATAPGPDPAEWDETRGMANKIVMVGAFSRGMAADEKTTPFGLLFGVEVIANTLNTIIMRNFLVPAPLWMSFLVLFILMMFIGWMSSRDLKVWIPLIALLAVSLAYFVAVFRLFSAKLFMLPLAAPIIGVFLTFLTVIAFKTVFLEKDKRRNKAMFSKMVGPDVLQEILDHGVKPGGHDRHMTVFFSDIRSFSSISERMKAQELLNYLNAYLNYMADAIKDYKGTIDKYIGDAVMGYWGAPLDQPEHALLACKCAMKSMEVLKTFNEGWLKEHPEDQAADIGIGISTGIMTVGLMGSRDHLNYTVIGDAVNLGSRLEGANKEYYSTSQGAGHYSRILISENTYLEVKDKVIARDLDVVRVKGRQQPTVIYELIDVVGGYEAPKPPKVKGQMLAAEAAAARRERAKQTRTEVRAKDR